MMARQLLEELAKGAGALVDVLMPPRCTSCKTPVAVAGLHCPDCWARLRPPAGSRCVTCSAPLPEQWAAEAECLQCLKETPAFDRARAPFIYGDTARQTVLTFKYGGEHLAPLMARAMLAAADGLGPDGHLAGAMIVPVPLHRWRLFRRGYNQAVLLGVALADLTGAELDRDSLVRVKPTESTRGLGRAARAAEVRGAFRVRADRKDRLKGAHVLLVDDVMTSGATAAACARVLKRAGATAVEVLTYARVASEGRGAYEMTMRVSDGKG